MTDAVLDIHNVTQRVSVDDVEVKTFGQKLREKIVEHTQEKLPNGNIRITLILDPSIQGVKDE